MNENIGRYSNGKKTVSKTAGSTALTRDVWVRIPPSQPEGEVLCFKMLLSEI